MLRVVFIIAVVALTIYAVVEIAQADSNRVRYLPKWLWFVIAATLVGVGPILWLLLGRPLPPGRSGGAAGNAARPTVRPPDDDTDFLSRL